MNLRQLILICSSVLLVSCSPYQKLLNSDDISLKYKEAENYYNAGEHRKANRLFEQVVPSYRGKPQAERVIFFFADTYYLNEDYFLAAYQFENFVKTYPRSQRVEEARFKAAKAYYEVSPVYSLDQKDTNTAIEKLQLFMDSYPDSERTVEANQMIAELQTKLEKKAFEIAKQYHTIRDYRASIQSFDNFVGSFPGTKFREEAMYYHFLSHYEIAVNSIRSKQLERLEELLELHQKIIRYYPDTIFLEDLDNKINRVQNLLEGFDTLTTP
ncbi:MAG: outer membrane protein assembly factor BamD [Flavobacteriaceae bacterium]